MRDIIKKIGRLFLIPLVLPDYLRYIGKDHRKRFKVKLSDFYPKLRDKTLTTHFDRHYIYHTSWAARILSETRPLKHVDVSSSLYFVGISSAFVPIDFYDYRQTELELSNLASKKGDLLALPFPDDSVASLSSMHVIEHIGLGRYGEPIDPDGDIKAMAELERVLKPNGSLLFVVPLGEKALIEFNAHRIYTYEQVVSSFSKLKLKGFSLIKEGRDEGGLIRNAEPAMLVNQKYACGCFWFTK